MAKDTYVQYVLKPINYPNEIQVQLHRLSPETDQPTGDFYYEKKNLTWEQIHRRFPVREDYFREVEGYLREGHSAKLAKDWIDLSKWLEK